MSLDVFNFFLIPIVFIGYRFSLKFCYLASALLSFFIILDLQSAPLYSKLLILFVFNTMPLITFGFQKKSREYKERLKLMLDEVRISYERLVSKDRGQLQSNLDIERKIQQVSGLYEISKQMSAGVSFEEVFEVLGDSLKRSFRFKGVALLIIKEEADEISDIFRIEQHKKTEKLKSEQFYLEIYKSLKAINGPLLLNGKRDENQTHQQIYTRLHLLRKIETLVAVPLSIENRTLAILCIENLADDYFDNFLILASQFAIQVERVFLYNRVQEMAITDGLTGVHTRRHLIERFEEEVRRSMRHKSSLSLLMLDIDHFKEKNDKFGHLVGDIILREIGRLLISSVREIDIVGRYGGEEFVIVLSNTTKKDAGIVAERIRQIIKDYKFKAYDEVVDVSVSLGVTGFPEDGVDAEGLIDCADRTLYRAKEAGRNRVVVYND